MTVKGNRTSTAGFTLLELMLALVVLGVIMSSVLPRVRQAAAIWGARRVAGLVANDLENAFSLAARQRRPVRLSCTCGSQQYTVTDRAAGTTLVTQSLGQSSGYNISGLTFSTNTVDIFPTGISSAPLTVTITIGASAKQVTMTQAGQVRVLP